MVFFATHTRARARGDGNGNLALMMLRARSLTKRAEERRRTMQRGHMDVGGRVASRSTRLACARTASLVQEPPCW
jgi:hypothetical protein